MYNLNRDFNNQTILACDDQGNFQQYISRVEGHTGEGRRHLAITVLLYNEKDKVLLQKRKHKIFDNIYDFTGSTHPVKKTSGGHESLEECTRRCLEDEYYIDEKIKLKNLGFFNYFEKYGELCENQQAVFCENEHCAMMVGEYNGKVNLNPESGYSYKWIDKSLFLEEIKNNPKNYCPWVIEGVKSLNLQNFKK